MIISFNKPFYFILLFIIVKESIQSHVVYPFKKSRKEKKVYPEDIIQNDLEITIEIGTPPQKIDLNLRNSEFTFFVTSIRANLPYTTFNETNSKSYIKLVNNSSFNKKEYKMAEKISESITINNQKIDNITLILATSLVYKESGALGLKLVLNRVGSDDLSFIYQMKNKSNFDNYAFTLKYDDNNDEKGELIIGSYPHIYNSQNYQENSFIHHSAGKIDNMIDWVFDFQEIKYDNKTINEIIKKSLFKIEYGLIQAPLELKKYFNDTFFLGKCNETLYSERNIYIITCDKRFDIATFKDLKFVLKDIEYEFVLTYKELFIEKDNKYIFGIAFDNNIYTDKDSYWILGKPFMKKYQLVFDLDNKFIGVYKNNKGNKDDKDNENSKEDDKNNFNILIPILIILSVIIIGLIIFIIYYVRKQRRNKAYELNDDNFDYSPSQ